MDRVFPCVLWTLSVKAFNMVDQRALIVLMMKEHFPKSVKANWFSFSIR